MADWQKPAAVSFSGLLGGGLSKAQNDIRRIGIYMLRKRERVVVKVISDRRFSLLDPDR
jgi:hypothetical protein